MSRINRTTASQSATSTTACLSCILAACVFLALLAQPAVAAIATSGNVEPADPSTWIWTTNGYVGNTSDGNMTIDSGSAVSSQYGYLGDDANATGTVTVDGSGSTWINEGLIIGKLGNGFLSISNGGSVTNKYGYIGTDSNSTGSVTVDGSGSTWLNDGELRIGVYGNGTLSITNDGAVTSEHSYIGYLSNSSGEVSVDGNSTWTHDEDLFVGYYGNGVLSITNGGTVRNQGYKDDTKIAHSPASTGKVTVDGAGSTWINDGLVIGAQGNGFLSVSNGGFVTNTYGYIGDDSNSIGSVTVDGNGSTWANDWQLVVGAPGNGTLSISNGGTVTTKQRCYIGRGAGSTGHVSVNDSGSTLDANMALQIGLYGGNGSLSIRNGGSVRNIDAYIGDQADSNGAITVDGNGSIWTSDANAHIGYEGVGTVSIINGGQAHNSSCYIGTSAGSNGTVTVDGNQSTLTSNSYLYVGNEGNGSLSITNHGKVSVAKTTYVAPQTSGQGIINFDNGVLDTGSLFAGQSQLSGTGTINTHGIVSDVDLVFSSTSDLSQALTMNSLPGQNITINLDFDSNEFLGAGYSDSGTLTIDNGMSITSEMGYMGYNSGSTGTATIDGHLSTWTTPDIYVGYKGNGFLEINNGGKSVNYLSHIGYYPGSTGHASVDGIGSSWTNEDEIIIGLWGEGTLSITNGGYVSSDATRMCSRSDSSGTAIVDGIGSTLTTGYFSVGDYGDGSVFVRNGGAIRNSGYLDIGNGYDATGTVSVDGNGSMIDSDSALRVGVRGQGTLSITNGGRVENTFTQLGQNDGSARGEVTVDGSGSRWFNSDTVYIGDYGNGSLSVTNNGFVHTTSRFCIGVRSRSTGEVRVDGSGSQIIIWDSLFTGYNGAGALSISNGGKVNNSTGYIGYGNRYLRPRDDCHGDVNVDGSGSIWINRNDLHVGYYGDGTLTISNGGLVRIAGTLSIGDGKGDGVINMSNGGMLAIRGRAEESLESFLNLINGTDDIRYWDDSISDWVNIIDGTYGLDYTLRFISEGDLATYTILTVPMSVEIDVKPGSDVNPINLKSGGVIPVAILTTETFDATTVDIQTVELSGAKVAVRGNGQRVMVSQQDVDGDGDIDILFHVETQDLAIEPGTTIVTLTGETFDGTKIVGTDDIKLVGDLDNDGTVGIVDLNMVLIDWGKTGAAITDLRADTDLSGDIGLEDLNAVLIDWGK